jgi:Integrase core domain
MENCETSCWTGKFYTLTEAKVLVERWRKEYYQVRPYSSLGYRPLAPEVAQSLGSGQSGDDNLIFAPGNI